MDEKKKQFNSRPLFYVFLSFLLAIATAKFVFDGNLRYIIFDVVILLVFIVYSIWKKYFKCLAVVLCVFMLGLGWFFVGLSMFEGKTYTGQVSVVGRISDDVKYSTYGGSATIILKDVTIDGESAGNISLVLSFDSSSDFEIGDIVSFTTNVQNVKLFTLGSFNSSYYRDRTPYTASVDIDEVEIQGNSLTLIEKFRLKVKEVLYDCMGETNGSVAYAVLFGDKNDLDDDVYLAYQSSGIIHLLTVSGLHVSFLIALLGWVLKKCRIKGMLNFFICLVFLGVYATFCGYSPSILRAGIMGLVLFFTRISGKWYDGLSSLGLAGLIILIFSPLSALDVGFLMSFFCVLSIYIIAPTINKLLTKIFPRAVASSFSISIGIQIGILPFLGMIDGTLNFLSFFVNLVVIPFFSVLYPLLFVSVLLVAMLPFLGFLLQICGWGFSVIEIVANFFGSTSLLTTIEPFDIFFVASLFVLFFLLSHYFLTSRKVKAICCSSVFALSAVLYGVSYVQFPVTSSLVYCYNYSYSVLVLTNSKGESVIVDFGYESFTRKLLNALEIKQITTAFVLQKPTILIDSANEIGVETLIRADGGQGYDNEVLMELNEEGSVGGFTFVYRGYGTRMLGLEISFDDTTIFILRDWTLTETQLSSLPVENYDFVVLGKHESYASYFDESSIFLTYYSCDIASSSYENDGNVAYEISGKNYSRRCLD